MNIVRDKTTNPFNRFEGIGPEEKTNTKNFGKIYRLYTVRVPIRVQIYLIEYSIRITVILIYK